MERGFVPLAVPAAWSWSRDPEKRATKRAIDQSIRRMVGIEAGVTSAPQSAWDQLGEVLRREGIAASEHELIAVPFVVEYSEELRTELER